MTWIETAAEGRILETGHFALWLMPAGTARARLAQLIRELSHEWSGPRFDPHVTLLAGISGRRKEILRSCEQFAALQRPFEIQLTEAGFLDDTYRALFLHVAPSPALTDAMARARKIFHHRGDPAHFPHLSLLYGHYPPGIKQRIIEQKGRNLDLKFSVERVFWVDIAGEPQDWTCVRDFPFRKAPRDG